MSGAPPPPGVLGARWFALLILLGGCTGEVEAPQPAADLPAADVAEVSPGDAADTPGTTDDATSGDAPADTRPSPDTDEGGIPCVDDDDCVGVFGETGQCARALCDFALCALRLRATGSACDDGDPCTRDDGCTEAGCVGRVADCGDGNPCTDDFCDAQGDCITRALEGPCDDGDRCTTRDRCQGGVCRGDRRICDDGEACTDEVCDSERGCVPIPIDDQRACEDGDACTVDDRCVEGACVGDTLDCGESATCLAVSCDPTSGCVRTPRGTTCDDGSDCTVEDRCVDGLCVGRPLPCDDDNPCTDDGCLVGEGCVNLPVDEACDDGSPCTLSDRCVDGTCRGAPLVCEFPPPARCADPGTLIVPDGIGACVAGACVHAERVVACPRGCHDGICEGADPCSALACDEAPSPCLLADGRCEQGRCVFAPNDGATCDDGDVCTRDDRCLGSACSGAPVPCLTPPPDRCVDSVTLRTHTRTGRCDAAAGGCAYEATERTCPLGCRLGGCVDGALDGASLVPFAGPLGDERAPGFILWPGAFDAGPASSPSWRLDPGERP